MIVLGVGSVGLRRAARSSAAGSPDWLEPVVGPRPRRRTRCSPAVRHRRHAGARRGRRRHRVAYRCTARGRCPRLAPRRRRRSPWPPAATCTATRSTRPCSCGPASTSPGPGLLRQPRRRRRRQRPGRARSAASSGRGRRCRPASSAPTRCRCSRCGRPGRRLRHRAGEASDVTTFPWLTVLGVVPLVGAVVRRRAARGPRAAAPSRSRSASRSSRSSLTIVDGARSSTPTARAVPVHRGPHVDPAVRRRLRSRRRRHRAGR